MADPLAINVSNDLIEAYVGYYEDEWLEEFHNEVAGANVADEEWKTWSRNRAIQKIVNHTPKRRLEVYLEWNGILGYIGRIYELATGHL
jgi:hypothetical protein